MLEQIPETWPLMINLDRQLVDKQLVYTGYSPENAPCKVNQNFAN